jgi:MFS family permease
MDEQIEESVSLIKPTLPRWWRVIPSLVLLIMIGTIDALILNDFIEYRYTKLYEVNSSSSENLRELCLNESRSKHNSPTLLSTTTPKHPVSTTMSPQDLVQSSTARLNVFIALASTIPSVLTAILLGSNCDRIGRKPLITLPYVGKIIRYFILTAAAYYNLSDLWVVFAVMFDSAFGTTGLSLLSSFSYLSDCTTEKTRTKAIIILDVCLGCSRFLPLLTMGIYLQKPNFVQSMVFTLLISVGGFLYCIVLQPESNLNVQHLNIFQQLAKTELRPVTRIFKVFLAKREEHKQRSLLIMICAHLCIIVMIYGFFAMTYIYLYGAPFCMDSFGVSLTTMAQAVTMVLLTVPFTLLIGKRSDHLFLPMLGCLAYMAQLVLFGIAKEVWMIYLAICIGSVFTVLIPVVRSRITKLVQPNEYACVFILAGIFESGGSYAFSAMGNEIYRATLTFYVGFVFFVFALFGGLSIILML